MTNTASQPGVDAAAGIVDAVLPHFYAMRWVRSAHLAKASPLRKQISSARQVSSGLTRFMLSQIIL